jgi:type IX secretion system PorP/SprF family membrane protein
MYNKAIGLFIVLIISAKALTAQQLPHYTQYIFNGFIINPAVAGIENYTDLKLSHRHQWSGVDGAPVTTYLTIQGPLTKSDNERETPTTFHNADDNPMGRTYWRDYQSADPHGGIGLTILNDRTGPLNRFSAAGSFAYHLGLSSRTSISMGVSAGIKSVSLNTSKLSFNNAIDPAVASAGYLNRLSPDLNAGIWLYSSDYFAGLSLQNIFPTKLKFSDDTVRLANGRLLPHTFITAGYRLFISDDISWLPSMVLKYISSTPLGFDINSKFQYQDLLWVGGSYRYHDSWSAMVGLNISNAINIGYSYDVTTSRLNAVTNGSHEIVVGFTLGTHYKEWGPRNMW